MAFEIGGKIQNTDSSSGLVDDKDLIGGYKVVDTIDDLDRLKTSEFDDCEFTGAEHARLKTGCLVYCNGNGRTYRWDGENFKEEIIQASGGDGGDGIGGGFQIVQTSTEFEDIVTGVKSGRLNSDNGYINGLTIYVVESKLTYRLNAENLDVDDKARVFTCINPNIERGTGTGAFQQQNGKAYAKGEGSVALNGGYGTDADGKETDGVCANGALNIAGGRDTTTYQACSYAFGKDCEAGLTAEEFLAKYPNGSDDWAKAYEESWSLACATGLETKAKGRNSHAQNRGTQALANDSSASGVESIASGANGSNANGFKTKASGEAAFTANNQTVASGAYASAFGTGGEASGKDSFKTGDSNKSQGACTFTMGLNNVANSYCCFVGGKNSETGSAQYTFQYGEGLRTVANNQVVFGKYNVKDSSKYNTLPVFTVAYGTSDSDRKDVFNVLRDGRVKVYGKPKDDDDVLRLGDLQDVSHANTANNAHAVNDIVFTSENECIKAHRDGGGITFAEDGADVVGNSDGTMDVYYNPLDPSYNSAVNYDLLDVENKFVFSDPTYGTEELTAVLYKNKTVLKGAKDGAYYKYTVAYRNTPVYMPLKTNNLPFHSAVNAEDAQRAYYADTLLVPNYYRYRFLRTTSNAEMTASDLSDGLYYVYMFHNNKYYEFGITRFIKTTAKFEYNMGMSLIDGNDENKRRYFRLENDGKSLFIRKYDSGGATGSPDPITDWVTDETILYCHYIGKLIPSTMT